MVAVPAANGDAVESVAEKWLLFCSVVETDDHNDIIPRDDPVNAAKKIVV